MRLFWLIFEVYLSIKKNSHISNTYIFRSPSGKINFTSSCLESAFARVSLFLPVKITYTKDVPVVKHTTEPASFNLKRKNSEVEDTSPKKIIRSETSPTLNNYEKTKSFLENHNTLLYEYRTSPPFLGFDNSVVNMNKERVCDKETISSNHFKPTTAEKGNEKDKLQMNMEKQTSANNVRKNGTLTKDELFRKRLQEQKDLELAKKLQAEFDSYMHNTRSSRKVGKNNIRRQTTLDEILTGPYRIK